MNKYALKRQKKRDEKKKAPRKWPTNEMPTHKNAFIMKEVIKIFRFRHILTIHHTIRRPYTRRTYEHISTYRTYGRNDDKMLCEMKSIYAT